MITDIEALTFLRICAMVSVCQIIWYTSHSLYHLFLMSVK